MTPEEHAAGLCQKRNLPTSHFFYEEWIEPGPARKAHVKLLKAMCAVCPSLAACDAEAERHVTTANGFCGNGFRAGLTETERKNRRLETNRLAKAHAA